VGGGWTAKLRQNYQTTENYTILRHEIKYSRNNRYKRLKSIEKDILRVFKRGNVELDGVIEWRKKLK
jgi:hypothetical protein